MIDISHNLENHKALKAMVSALEISDNNLITTKHGNLAVSGKDDKPLKAIQYLEDKYFYYISDPSKRKQSAIRNKLIKLGMTEEYETAQSLYMSLRRLPEPHEASLIRRLLGYKPSRSKSLTRPRLPRKVKS